MATRSFDSGGARVQGVRHNAGFAAGNVHKYLLKHRLVVVAPTMVEVVRFAGGLLFDRVMAGWDATVLTADSADSRPVRILGASAVDLDSALASPDRALRPEAVVAAAELYGCDARVRRMMQRSLDQGSSDVRLWGRSGVVAGAGGGGTSLPHRLSLAARAFKAHALMAAEAPCDSVDVVEMFVAAGCAPGERVTETGADVPARATG